MVHADSGVQIHAKSASTTAVLELAGTRSSGAAAVAISRIKSIPENPAGNSDDTSLAFETRSQSGGIAEAMRITSDGKFGFNTTNPGAFDSGANNFVVLGNTSGTGNSGINIVSGNDSYGNIYFGDGAGAASYRGFIAYNHNGDTLRFGANGTEQMRIDSVGRLISTPTYSATSGSSANVGISSAGKFFRSTSSSKYKTDIETLEDSYSDALLNCRPVWYHSLCADDNPEHGFWGFIAEEVAEIDPRLVFWKTNEVTHDEKGSPVETPCDPEPEGVAYDRFVPHLLNLIKRQQSAIETLEQRLSDAGIA
tara:strand:- start:55 stop:981 length:927 start_codon:yes stop_codon:yes gene_type:complete